MITIMIVVVLRTSGNPQLPLVVFLFFVHSLNFHSLTEVPIPFRARVFCKRVNKANNQSINGLIDTPGPPPLALQTIGPPSVSISISFKVARPQSDMITVMEV